MSRTNFRFVACLMLICLTAAVVPASAQHFKQITGTPLSQIAAGRKEVWGLYNSRIYRFNPNTQGFDQVQGSLFQIAVGGGTLMQRDEVWGIGSNGFFGYVSRFDFSTNAFTSVPTIFEQCPNCVPVFFSQIAVGTGDKDNCHPYEVWGLSNFPVASVYRYNYCTSSFDKIPAPSVAAGGNGKFTQIGVGPTGDVWGLWEGSLYPGSPTGSTVFEFTRGYDVDGWDMCSCQAGSPGTFAWQQISVGTNQGWAVDSYGAIWFWAPPLINKDNISMNFNAPNCAEPLGCQPGLATKIASGADGVWFLYTSFAEYRFGQVGHFDPGFGFLNVQLPADANPAAVQIAVGSGAGVWVLDASDEVFTFVRP